MFPTRIRSATFIAATVVASLLIINCSKIKGPLFRTEADASLTPSIGEAIFPHKTLWGEPENHGKAVRSGGITSTSACAGTCHGDNLEGGIGPSCKKCHADWPHVKDWASKDGHGKFALEKGKTRCATKCHGTDLGGGLSGVGCLNCHAYYPHYDGFTSPEEHGPLAKGLGKNDCAICHGADWKGSDTGISCTSCHANYPHSDDWSKKENHGAWVNANSKSACMTACHGTDLKGGLSDVSCDDCHTIWPSQHQESKWNEVLHGDKFSGLGETACLGCHGEDWKGAGEADSCYKCHDSLPYHYEEDWKNSHGKYVMDNNSAKDDFAECKKCHGTGLEGTGSAPSCSQNTCHASYPDKHMPDSWKGYSGHGKYVGDKKDKTECQLCHGTSFTGGVTGVTCYNESCHKTYPHPLPDYPNWETTGAHDHGKYFVDKEDKNNSTCAKTNCHGADLDGNAEAGAPSCSACHIKMPHGENWEHGLASLTQLDKCKECHGADLKGDGSASSCYKCHKSFPSPHTTENWTTTGAGHGEYVLSNSATKEDCKICHGDDLNGGVSGKTCHNPLCHQAYPHDIGWDHGAEVLLKNVKAKSPYDKFDKAAFNAKCKNCHGAVEEKFDNKYPNADGLMPNGVVKRCYNEACHGVYPHLYYEDYSPMYQDLKILIKQTWGPQIGHKSYIYYNEEYCAKSWQSTQCAFSDAEMENLLTSTSGKGCYGSVAGFCHNNTRHHKSWHVFNPYCSATCHIEN